MVSSAAIFWGKQYTGGPYASWNSSAFFFKVWTMEGFGWRDDILHTQHVYKTPDSPWINSIISVCIPIPQMFLCKLDHTVDGRDLANQLIGSLSLIYRVLYIHPRWLFGISSINSISPHARTDSCPVTTAKGWSNLDSLTKSFPSAGNPVGLSITSQFFGYKTPHLSGVFRCCLKLRINIMEMRSIPYFPIIRYFFILFMNRILHQMAYERISSLYI